MLEANTILGNNAIILTALKKTLLAAGEPLCAALVAVGARSDTEVKQLSDANVESDIVKAMLFDQAFIIAALAMFAECTVPEIATFTGHSLKDVEHILDRHYLGRDLRLAESAMAKLAGMFASGACKVEGNEPGSFTSKTVQRPADRF